MNDNNGDQPPTKVGSGDDETAIVLPLTEAAPELAWSTGDVPQETLRRQSWGVAWGQAAVIAACGLALAVSIGAAVFVAEQTRQRTAVTPAPMPASALPPIPPAAPSVVIPTPSAPAVTSTVTVAAPPTLPPRPAPSPPEGTFAICPSGHSGVATTVTSCAFADSVRRAYLIQGGPDVQAYSPVTGDTYAMEYIGGFTAHLSDGEVVQAVRCTGGNNAVVVMW